MAKAGGRGRPRWRALATLAIIIVAIAVPRVAAAGEPVSIVDYGIYDHRVERFEAEPRQISGERVIVSGVKLIRQADEVDAQPGRLFGFQFRVTDPMLVGETLTIRRIVPPLTNPATGRTATTIEREVLVSHEGQLVLNAYRFDYGWEMAEGIWRFQVLWKGKVLAEKAIKVVVAIY